MPKVVLVFAAYNETPNLREILAELSPKLSAETLVIIADDSGPTTRAELEQVCREAMVEGSATINFSYSDTKAGRGAAVRRSFNSVRDQFPEVEWFVEADSDGSHRPEDILEVLSRSEMADLVIGSRYVQGSQIIGWPVSRRALSKVLNTFIPIFLRVDAKDLTNGLRGYSTRAVDVILSKTPQNSGFIYLSEVAQEISKSGLTIDEVPIIFNNRVHGSSTVGWSELSSSLWGVLKLVSPKK